MDCLVEDLLSRILRFYVIREVALPTLLTLLTIVFIMLMSQVYKLITLLMQPSVPFHQAMDALLGFIPQLLVLAVPMAVLIGTLIGVGRMTLDREMLAARASGINLFRVYLPTLIIGLLLSLIIMGLSYKLIPQMLLNSFEQVSKMELALVTSLDAGEFHGPKDMAQEGEGRDFQIYFRERDANNSSIMKGIMIKLDDSGGAGAKNNNASASDSTSATQTAASGDRASSATLQKTAARRNQLTFITAESGVIGLSADAATTTSGKGAKRADTLKSQLVINLKNGAFHQLSPDPDNRQYMSGPFATCQYTLPGNNEIKKVWKTESIPELLRDIRNNSASTADDRKKAVGQARRELTQRLSISLASFVFFLIGIPLAIWVRPSGKSWGILLAIGLMLIYYVILSAGLIMVESNKPFGIVVAFSPNLLYLFLGAGLWRHTVRS